MHFRHFITRVNKDMIAILALLVFGCNSINQNNADEQLVRRSRQIVTERFEGSFTFPYVASDKKKNRVFSALAKAQVGCSLESVLEIAGPPDYCQTWGPKLYPSKGLSLTYYLYKPEESLVREGLDVAVDFDFDIDDQLVEMPVHWHFDHDGRFVKTPVGSKELEQLIDSRPKHAALRSQ